LTFSFSAGWRNMKNLKKMRKLIVFLTEVMRIKKMTMNSKPNIGKHKKRTLGRLI